MTKRPDAMNCDEAFEVLTRGPFPSGAAGVDAAVERHLTACHDCCELAEALRPAVGLLHEALAGTDSLGLPGYRGELSAADGGTIQTLAAQARLAPHTRTLPIGSRQRNGGTSRWAVVSAALLGLVLGLFAQDLRRQSAAGTHAGRAAAERPASRPQSISRDGRLLLASLNLPPDCRQTNDDAGTAAGAWYQCCTLCHAANDSAAAPAVRVTALTTSCLVCHSNVYRAEVSWRNLSGSASAML